MKKSGTTFILVSLVAILAIGGFVMMGKTTRPPSIEQPAMTSPAEPAMETQPTSAAPQEEAKAKEEAEKTFKAPSSLSYDNASLPAEPLGERTLGNPLAPVKIEEFSSLTCPHCSHFHKGTFAALKEKYIDTGKVFFTFTDFPLNAPALDAAMIARCMPPERYFTFVAFLYETQEQWAFGADPGQALRQGAKLAGMDDSRFDSCLADTALKEGIVNRMKEKSEANPINSTPSFLINGKTVLTGALPIAAFDQAIEDAGKPADAEETPMPAPEQAAPAPVPAQQ